jgi:hypothetical protein
LDLTPSYQCGNEKNAGLLDLTPSYNSGVQPERTRHAPAGLFNGEALTLWRLRRGTTRIACFVAEWPGAYWLAVECAGGELLSSETVSSVEAVMAGAEEARARWLQQGWTEE